VALICYISGLNCLIILLIWSKGAIGESIHSGKGVGCKLHLSHWVLRMEGGKDCTPSIPVAVDCMEEGAVLLFGVSNLNQDPPEGLCIFYYR